MRESLQRGLHVADQLNDTYFGHLSKLREDFDKIRDDLNRGFDFLETPISRCNEFISSASNKCCECSRGSPSYRLG